MQAELMRSLCAPFRYWRTGLLVLIVGSLVATIFRDAIAVLLCTLASAFVFSRYERRRWISMPTELLAGDVVLRLAFALAATYVFCSTQWSPALRLIAAM